MPTPDRLLDILAKACLATFILTALGIIALLILIFCCPNALGCTNHDCSNDNAATGPVVAGDEIARANSPAQAITHYEWRQGDRVCKVQPYREVYNSHGHFWTQPWLQPYASECPPLEGWDNLYRVRACYNSRCSPDSAPVTFRGLRYCNFNDPDWLTICFGERNTP